MVFARDLAEVTRLSRALIQRPRRGLGREEGALRGTAGARPDAAGLKGCQVYLLPRTMPQITDHGVGVGGEKARESPGTHHMGSIVLTLGRVAE